MPIYELTDDRLLEVESVGFADAGIRERQDLQRLLRDQVEIISPDTLVIAEEFGDWEDARRRIDLLGIDKAANLVVIELKRTSDGGYMDLQAIRYAGMVSAMTFEKAVDVYGAYLRARGETGDPQKILLDFLELESPNEEVFGQEVCIVLASAEFSKELTTSVLWLNDHGLDVRCMRLKPYRHSEKLFVSVDQVIPLPEAAEFQVNIREKRQRERESRQQNRDFTKYDVSIAGKTYTRQPKRWAIFRIVKDLCSVGVSPKDIIEAIPWRKNRMFRSIDREVNGDAFVENLLAQQQKGIKNCDPGRFFCADDELIIENGHTYALTKMWGNRTAEAMHMLAEKYPQHHIRVVPTSQ